MTYFRQTLELRSMSEILTYGAEDPTDEELEIGEQIVFGRIKLGFNRNVRNINNPETLSLILLNEIYVLAAIIHTVRPTSEIFRVNSVRHVLNQMRSSIKGSNAEKEVEQARSLMEPLFRKAYQIPNEIPVFLAEEYFIGLT